MRSRCLWLGFACAIVLSVAGPAPAHAATAAAGPGGFLAGFVTPVVIAAQGEAITFLNGDIAPHNFVADGAYLPRKVAKKTSWCSSFTPTTCPLFWSPTATTGESVEVQGLDGLKAGSQYAFHCSLHPNMRGTLVVR